MTNLSSVNSHVRQENEILGVRTSKPNDGNFSLRSRSLRERMPWSLLNIHPPASCKLPKDTDTAVFVSKSQKPGTSSSQLWINGSGRISPLLRPSRSGLESARGHRRQPALCPHTDPSQLGSGRVPRILSFSEHVLEK